MNFMNDLRSFAENVLDHYGLDHTSSEKTTAVLRRWVNLQLRLIPVRPRKVSVSAKILAMTLDTRQKHAFDAISQKFENGDEVNSHLSKTIFQEDYTDYLFTDWAIHHLHLSTTPDPKNPRFVKRSDKLLFIMLNDSDAYFIDIRDHGEDYVFAQKELLQVVHDSWPQIIKRYRLNVISVEREFNDPEEIHKLRKAGVNIMYKVGDAVYMPIGGGVNTAATSANMVMQTDNLIHIARNSEDWAKTNQMNLLQEVRQMNPSQRTLDLHLVLDQKGYFVGDFISKKCWKINT